MVRWFDHRCKVNSDEFDRVQKRTGGSFLSEVAWQLRGSSATAQPPFSHEHRRPQAEEYLSGLQPLTVGTSRVSALGASGL
jgi:hypothetical protein